MERLLVPSILSCMTQKKNMTLNSRIHVNPPLIITSSYISGSQYDLITDKLANPLEWNTPPSIVPSIRQEKVEWGTNNKMEVFYYVSFVFIFVFCCLVSLIIAIHALFVRWKSGAINKNLFQKMKKLHSMLKKRPKRAASAVEVATEQA